MRRLVVMVYGKHGWGSWKTALISHAEANLLPVIFSTFLLHLLSSSSPARLSPGNQTGTNCCYAKQDKFWVNDPDNVQWEVYYFHADAEFNDPNYSLNEATACCTVSTTEVKSNCGCNADVSIAGITKQTEKITCC